MITKVDVTVEKALNDIEMKARKVVICMECDGKNSWVSSLGEVCPTQSKDKWMDFGTNSTSGEEPPQHQLDLCGNPWYREKLLEDRHQHKAMGMTSEGTKIYVVKEMQPQRVIVVSPYYCQYGM